MINLQVFFITQEVSELYEHDKILQKMECQGNIVSLLPSRIDIFEQIGS